MSTEQSPPSPRLPLGVPSIYADHLTDAIYGFHTTKLVLGVEVGNAIGPELAAENLRPVAVLTIPTPMLFAAAMKIVQDLSGESMLQETATRYHLVLQQMQAAGAALRGGSSVQSADAVGSPASKEESAG